MYAIHPPLADSTRLAQSVGGRISGVDARWAKVTSEMETDQFTLDEANTLVPWLADTFKKLEVLRLEYAAVQERLAEIQMDTSNTAGAGRLTATAEQLSRQIEEGVEEILDNGIIVRDVSRGLVDFPSQRDGREVYLCWIGGEERIDYWHETDRGFSHRQPL